MRQKLTDTSGVWVRDKSLCGTEKVFKSQRGIIKHRGKSSKPGEIFCWTLKLLQICKEQITLEKIFSKTKNDDGQWIN